MEGGRHCIGGTLCEQGSCGQGGSAAAGGPCLCIGPVHRGGCTHAMGWGLYACGGGLGGGGVSNEGAGGVCIWASPLSPQTPVPPLTWGPRALCLVSLPVLRPAPPPAGPQVRRKRRLERDWGQAAVGATALPAEPQMQILCKHGLSHSSAPPRGTPAEKGQESPGDRETATSKPRYWYQSLTSAHWFGYLQVMGSP